MTADDSADSRRVWVVDDDRSVRFVLATALRDAGYEVDGFENAASALAALREIDRERQAHWPGTDHDDRMLRHIGARPLLVGVAAIAELGFGLCRVGVCHA